MTDGSAVDVVRRWQGALNREERGEVARLSSPDVEIAGPRGTARGLDVLRRWLAATRVTLVPRRTFARGEAVVVAQDATWRCPETGEDIGRAEVASVFRVHGGRVAFYARHDLLDDALRQAGLTPKDEVEEEG